MNLAGNKTTQSLFIQASYMPGTVIHGIYELLLSYITSLVLFLNFNFICITKSFHFNEVQLFFFSWIMLLKNLSLQHKISYLKHFKALVPNLSSTRDWFCGRRFFHGLGVVGGRVGSGDGSGGSASNGERWGAADEAWLAGLPLTSCCAARFLTGCGLVLVCGLGVGDPCFKVYSTVVLIISTLLCNRSLELFHLAKLKLCTR